MGFYSIKPSHLLCWYVIVIIICGGFIIKDWRKFLGLNESPARSMAGSKKVPGNKSPGYHSVKYGMYVQYIRTYICTHVCTYVRETYTVALIEM